MKRCSYCGRENADDAETCAECGSSEFGPQPEPKPPPNLATRLGLGLVTGAAVAALSVFVAWRGTRNDEGLVWERHTTVYELQHLPGDIETYQKKFGHLPSTLDDLTNSRFFANGGTIPLPLDSWERPFVYSIEGTNYLIKSLGRDGKPGGKGLDCDLTTRDLQPPGSGLTLTQFLYDAPTGRMLWTCAISGIITAILTAILVRRPDFSPNGLKKLGLRIGATIIGAMLVAAWLAALHVPVHYH